MYLEMIKTIPAIELFGGIPSTIGFHDFLDVCQRNLIVLDDLMAQSGDDKRIADLFTKLGWLTETCQSSTLPKIYFIKERKQETSALIRIILYSSLLAISSKFLLWQDRLAPVGFKSL